MMEQDRSHVTDFGADDAKVAKEAVPESANVSSDAYGTQFH
jgi:hypothetical protein